MEDPVKERELLDMFKQIDVDGSKTLSLNEIILYLKSLTEDISEDNIVQIFSNFDKTGDRMVDFEEFKVRGCAYITLSSTVIFYTVIF